MVERCVRDAEVACSNHVASIFRPVGQAVKTTPSHGVNPGSIPGQVTGFCRYAEAFFHFTADLFYLFHISRLNRSYIPGDSLPWPVPPLEFKQCINGFLIKSFSYRFCRNTSRDCIRRNILCHNRPRSYNSSIANRNTR